jgi:Calpain family cysteine protease
MGENRMKSKPRPQISRLTRKLSVETLETRNVMAASLTATLTSGVLRIEGTASADTITLSQANGKISIKGLSSTYAATSVQSISIKTLAGNDKVSLLSLKSSSASFTGAIEIINSSGTDSITAQTGTVSSLGVSTLKFSATTTATTWFDANIQDTALKALLKTSFADNKLDRKEILNVFKQTATDGKVTSTEFSDLGKVAANASLFTSVEYVGVLFKNVVSGNVANAKYKGTSLGNLTANASATQLNNLVNKWFLGADRPVATYGATSFTYTVSAGTLFGANGPQYSDVKQGLVGDCYFVGTLAEVALKSPNDIRNMFVVNGDGTYTVRFFNNGKAEYVTVDSALPTYNGRFMYANYGGTATNTSNVLWVGLAEKAYVQLNECGWIRTSTMGGGQNSYQAIAGGWFSAAVSHIANKSSTFSSFGSTTGNTFDTFKTAFDSGKMVGFASNSAPGSSLIVGGHQYVAVGYDAVNQTVTMYNPWGVNNGSSYPGLVTIRWVDMASSFSYWNRTN